MTGAGASGASEPIDPAVLALRKAKALGDLGKLDDALTAAEEGLRHAPDDTALLTLEAWLLLKAERPAEAKPLLVELVAAQPEDALCLFLLSVAHSSLGDLKDARLAADRALELDPQTARYHLQIALLAVEGPISAADRELAIARVASALELEPESPSTLRSAAEIYRSLGDTDAAKGFVARGLAVAPQDQSLLFMRAVLIGDYTPTSATDQGGLPHVANQVTALGELLGMAPDNVQAGQVLFGRVWGQLLRLVDTPLIMIAIVALSVGAAMGSGPSLHNIYWGAGFAVVWPLFRVITTRSVLSKAPRGYLRRMTRGGADARLRLTASVVTVGIGVVGVLCLLWLREASLVRWLLLLLVVGAVVGAAASVLWYRRYFDAAIESGIFAPTELGFRSARIARSSIARSLTWRVVVLVLAGIPAAMISVLTRADAAPVLMLAVAAWVSPLVYALWRTRAIASRLADVDHAPPGVRPSLVGGPVAGVVSLAVAAVAVLAIVQAPWLPSERDAAGTYIQVDSTSDLYDDCTGRYASRLTCIVDKNEERIEEMNDDLDELDIPDFDVPTLPPLPTFTPPPTVGP
ncbi:tetratricopeptide repeat protein [Salinibacterium soli]|uniref:Tetratricopeptide repeat protein n=1 Tax=Antiquaquibacter soli TaxID=3064523 RepID=A0ABT9BQ14_9MICO|nr:tetratricopeptide repeat protein [Protaetiibacter sp. WY-16]MDO7883099.1 tetratricopeptide repeat protein [Protaetiibacter sp. WY-16]